MTLIIRIEIDKIIPKPPSPPVKGPREVVIRRGCEFVTELIG